MCARARGSNAPHTSAPRARTLTLRPHHRAWPLPSVGPAACTVTGGLNDFGNELQLIKASRWLCLAQACSPLLLAGSRKAESGVDSDDCARPGPSAAQPSSGPSAVVSPSWPAPQPNMHCALFGHAPVARRPPPPPPPQPPPPPAAAPWKGAGCEAAGGGAGGGGGGRWWKAAAAAGRRRRNFRPDLLIT